MKLDIARHIISKNNQLIAFNKPCGMLVQSGRDEDKSLLELAGIYCQHPLGLVHRLDRPASGVCLFAKTKKALSHFTREMQTRQVEKTYWAVVPKGDLPKEATLVHYIKRNGKTKRAEVATEAIPDHKKAELSYRIKGEIDNYSLLEIRLYTGRFHQIRAQLANIGFPIKGDVKYGAKRSNPDRSIHLHARSLVVTHPISKEKIEIVAEVPDDTVWKAFF